jgi:hypothetical protein
MQSDARFSEKKCSQLHREGASAPSTRGRASTSAIPTRRYCSRVYITVPITIEPITAKG